MQRPIVPLLRKSLERISHQFRSTPVPCLLSRNCTVVSLPGDKQEGLLRGNGDRLILKGMRFHGKHGVFEEERNLGQKFDVDVDAWMDIRKAGETDQLEDSVSYVDIYRTKSFAGFQFRIAKTVYGNESKSFNIRRYEAEFAVG